MSADSLKMRPFEVRFTTLECRIFALSERLLLQL
jgi:hypothetical protein